MDYPSVTSHSMTEHCLAKKSSKCSRTYGAFPAQMVEEHFVFLLGEKNGASIARRPPD